MDLQQQYSSKVATSLEPTAQRLQQFLGEILDGIPHIDRISVRVKGIERFVAKAAKRDSSGQLKYSDPLHQIQDQIGARVVCFYLQDVGAVAEAISDYFNDIEHRDVEPDDATKFGYFGKHYILLFPDEVIDVNNKAVPGVFELQIKTLFQHAWSEAEHDLSYKPQGEIDGSVLRRVAFTAAQAWGADKIFSELYTELTAANDG